MTTPEADRIDGGELLWRRVHPDHYVPRSDGSDGWSVVSGAFRTSDPELSVDREAILRLLGEGVAFTARRKQEVNSRLVLVASFAGIVYSPVEIMGAECGMHPKRLPGQSEAVADRLDALVACETAAIRAG